MIVTNSALYLGIFSASVLDRCPKATLFTEAEQFGYKVTAAVRLGNGKDTRSMVQVHSFTHSETTATAGQALTDAARFAGNQLGEQLAVLK